MPWNRRLAYRHVGIARGARRDEDTMIVLFWKMIGVMGGALALLFLILGLTGRFSYHRMSLNQDPSSDLLGHFAPQDQQPARLSPEAR